MKDSGAMSIAEKLAAARGDVGSGAAVTETEAETPAAGEEAAPEAEATEVEEVEEVQTDTSGDSAETVDRSNMSVDDMVTWCREHDGQ